MINTIKTIFAAFSLCASGFLLGFTGFLDQHNYDKPYIITCLLCGIMCFLASTIIITLDILGGIKNDKE